MGSDFYSKFLVKEKIGEGTFSEVLKCQKVNTRKIVAVKRLKKEFKNLCEAEEASELRVMQTLPPHPNVLALLEFLFDPLLGKLYMVFEFMDMSLYDMIQSRSRCFPEAKVKHLFYQILKGVHHLHSNSFFHRDIKPENILVKKSVVKLADLGSVRSVNSRQPYTEYISTRWYRAPECILTSGCYGPKMDVWACGCVFYELLTSKPMFPGSNEIDQLSRIHQVVGTPNPRVLLKIHQNRSRHPDVKFTPYPNLNLAIKLPFTSEGGRDILKKMLAYDPDVRTTVHRLLEHRYFNDLREEDVIRGYNSSPIFPLKWSSQLQQKQKPKLAVWQPPKKKEPVKKLGAHSWVPSTKTSKVILPKTKSKLDNRLSPKKKYSPNKKLSPIKMALKKRPGQPVMKLTDNVKKNSASTSHLISRIPVKVQQLKASSTGVLPHVNCKKEVSKRPHIQSFAYKSLYHNLLPAIPES